MTPFLDARCQSKPGNKSEVSMTRFFGSINLLEWLTDLRELFYLLDYRVIIKGYDSATARWKRCMKIGIEKGCRVSMIFPSTPLSPNLHGFTNL